MRSRRRDDSCRRPQSVTNGHSETTLFYDALGRAWKTVYASGVREEKSFDALSRPTSIVVKNSANAVLRSESLAPLASLQIVVRAADGVSTAGSVGQRPSGYEGGLGYHEDAFQFKLLGHRLYDPVAGRFLSRDPIRVGRKWYSYCGGDFLAPGSLNRVPPARRHPTPPQRRPMKRRSNFRKNCKHLLNVIVNI